MKRSLLTALALVLPLMAAAQGVWRCGPDGRSFSDTPCTDGRPLDVAIAARPAEDVRAAQSQAERDIQRADALRRERLAQEALQRGTGLAAIGPQADAVKPRKRERDRVLAKERPTSRQLLRREADGTWRAVAPSSRRTKG